MTISAQGVRAVYPGAGSTGPFTLEDGDSQAILFVANAEIVVTRFSSLGVPTILTIVTDYTLTGAGSSTAGSLTLVSALAVGETLVIQRVTPRTQLIDLIAGGKLSMTSIEGMFDKLIRIDQEDYEASLRTILLPATYVGDSIVFPEPEDDTFIGWDTGALVNLPYPAVLRSGLTNPSDGLGNDGDFYLNTATLKLFGPKAAGAWGVGVSIVGPEGTPGTDGSDGAAATIAIGTVTTGAPGTDVIVTNVGSSSAAIFDITIPRGDTGASGSGTGDVVGPASAVSDNIAVFDGTSGKIIADGGVTISSLLTEAEAASTYLTIATAAATYLTIATAASTYQPLDATLTALAAYNTNGLVTQTAADTFTGRTITGTTNEISVSSGDGVSGNPTLSLPSTIDLGGKTSLEIPNSATPTVDADGEIAIDTTITDMSHGLIRYFSGEECVVIAVPAAEIGTLADGDGIFYNATNDEFEIRAPTGGSGGAYLQVLQNTYTTNAALSTTIPYDDTIPTSSEGTQVLSQAITPSDNTNKIECSVSVYGSCNAGDSIIVALFRGTTCIEVFASGISDSGNTTGVNVKFTYLDSPASTSSQTYSVRVGGRQDVAAAIRLNGTLAARRFGGASACTLIVREVAA